VSAPESRVIEKYVDGFLIVVGAHRTPRRLVEEALNLVEPAKILGMVFNGDDRHLSKYTDVTRRRRIARSSTRRGQTALGE
jgi:Mrp family chromosome partitioning ATPase